MSFLTKLKTKYRARFITAAPLRVDFFSHALEEDAEANRQAAHDLLAGPHHILTETPDGKLIACNDGVIFLVDGVEFPIKFFCAWKALLVKKKPAVQAKFVWCDQQYRKLRLNGKPLGAYCLFDVLLPRHQIVVSADQHTPDGERWEKNQIQYAKQNSIHVYVRDENDKLFSLDDPSQVLDDADLFWGYAPEHRRRLFIYSLEEL